MLCSCLNLVYFHTCVELLGLVKLALFIQSNQPVAVFYFFYFSHSVQNKKEIFVMNVLLYAFISSLYLLPGEQTMSQQRCDLVGLCLTQCN